MSKKVKVVFPSGRTAYLDQKTAETKTVVRMGGRIVREPEPIVVPKAYAAPVAVPVVEAEDYSLPTFDEEADEVPAKKPLGRPKKTT